MDGDDDDDGDRRTYEKRDGGSRGREDGRGEKRRAVKAPGYAPLLWLALALFVVGYMLGYVNQMDTIYAYTYFDPVCAPGTLTSERLSPHWWTEFLLGVFFRPAFIAFTVGRVFAPANGWLTNFHFIVGLTWLATEIANAVVLGLQIPSCNGANSEGNPCNDYRWCAVFGINSTACPQNRCAGGNGTECTIGDCSIAPTVPLWDPPVANAHGLSWNAEFSISFYLSIVMSALGLFLIVISYLSSRPTFLEADYWEDPAYVSGKQKQPSTGSGYDGFPVERAPSYPQNQNQYGRIASGGLPGSLSGTELKAHYV
jgi:hypothetical protein